MSAVDDGRIAVSRKHIECATYLAAISRDVDKDFQHIEMTVNGYPTIVADKLFLERAREVIAPPKDADRVTWYRGTTVGSFDGKIIVEDVSEDQMPRLTLRLTAGGKDVVCYWPGFATDDFEPLLGRRVRVRGLAHYDGKSGLPVRIDIQETPRRLKSDADFTRWSGALKPLVIEDWDGDH
jgi:hypothetical protein